MGQLKLIYGYQDTRRHRLSFNLLTEQVFGFSLDQWYQQGFWNDKYVPYSYVDGDEVVANVSVNKMDLILEGEWRKAIQIGTVMTHPDYRGRGLATGLMDYVLDRYQGEYDLFFLFANRSAADFYPRFGFRTVAESRFTLPLEKLNYRVGKPAKTLDLSVPEDCKLICELISARKPISEVMGVEKGENLAMFHCLYVFTRCLYYLEEEAVLAICSKKDRTLHIYDLICTDRFDIHGVISRLADESIDEVVFHFTPDLLDLDFQCSFFMSEDILYVRGELFKERASFKFPITAQA